MTPIEQNISKWVDELLAIPKLGPVYEIRLAQLIIALVEERAELKQWKGPPETSQSALEVTLRSFSLSPDKFAELKERVEV